MLKGRYLGVLSFAAALVAAGPTPEVRPRPEHQGPPPALGQWVWTQADAELLTEATTAGIFVGTVRADDGVRWSRALSPALSVPSSARAAVIRFDDSLHGHWDDPGFEAKLTHQLESILAQLGPFAEVQLDYDAPVRRLARWGGLVRRWSDGPLAGRAVWVTSIPAHLSRPDAYRRAFAGAVDGHILQVFDTGLSCSPRHVERLSVQAAETALPYRLGVGAFERVGHTDHGCWFRQWRRLGHAPGFEGLWVFPAGHAYRHLIES